jgi:HPt (histidine-containing phosphotransfer) domain-containing protein
VELIFVNDNTAGPVDQQRIRAVCGDDDTLAIELIGMLVKEAEPIVAALIERVRCYEVGETNELAHALKGIAGSVGAVDLQHAATRLEAASGRKCTPTSSVLEAEVGAISRALECIRILQRSWWASAAGHTGIFAA